MPFFGGLILDLVLAWLIWRMLGQARRYASLPSADACQRPDWPSVAIVVPARNEAGTVGRCLTGLLNQDYRADRVTICLVDDNSSDETADVAWQVAGHDPRFRLRRGAALPQGWTGKSFACWQGARAAPTAEYLCFVDADTAAQPGLIRAAVDYAEKHELDMVSLEPFQELGTVGERLVFPCGLYLMAASQDVGRINSPVDPAAAANGQFILMTRAAYDAVGGHAAVRSEICEDSALARLAKRRGFRFRLLGAERFIRTRMYSGWASLWAGLGKNATELAGSPGQTVLIAAAGFSLVLAMFGLGILSATHSLDRMSNLDLAGDIAVGVGIAAMTGLHLAGARHFRLPLAYGFLYPFGYGLALAISVNSARLAWIGRVEWKGRIYGRPARVAGRLCDNSD